MTVKPLGDRVLIKVEKAEAKTSSGRLFIPDTALEKTQTGIVVAIGDDKDTIKVKSGDHVMYDKYAGTPIKIEDAEHLIVKMDDIIAIVD